MPVANRAAKPGIYCRRIVTHNSHIFLKPPPHLKGGVFVHGLFVCTSNYLKNASLCVDFLTTPPSLSR